MATTGEHKIVQARILGYAQEIDWSCVSRDDAERRRGFYPAGVLLSEWARKPSLFFGGPGCRLMTAQIRVHDLDLPELTSFTAMDAR